MIIRTSDGKRFAGRDSKAVVRRMRDDGWHVEFVPKSDYMEAVANRVQQMTGEIIPVEAEGFLLALQNLKLITIEGAGPVQ